jgi:hypothetical protein
MLITHKVKQIITKNNHRLACLIVAGMVLAPIPVLAGSPPATLPSPPPSSASCNSSGCDLITEYLQPAINLLAGVVGIIVVISLIMGGIEYSTSEGDPQKSAKAKRRIANTLFALIAFFFLYAFLQFLVPGGIF